MVPFIKGRNLRGYYQIWIKLCTSLNYEILGQLSAISVSQAFPSLMTGHTWPDLTLLWFSLAGGCSRSATLQTCPQEAPDGDTGLGDPRAFSHYKCDFFPASHQAAPPSPKVKTCAKRTKLQHEIWCGSVCSLHNVVLNSPGVGSVSQDNGSLKSTSVVLNAD